MAQLCEHSASELAALLRRREASCVELLDDLLVRIERQNPGLNAIVTLDAEGARLQARAADVQADQDGRRGALHGVPFTLKDCFETAGMRTTAGHLPLAEHVPPMDCTVAARLKASGAILLGKTNVPPLAMSLQTANDIFGRTNNPWDPARTPGGSSGGAAAAVAACLVPFDIGSDMSGSIRIPAHYCGIYGFKPTANRVPGTGHLPPPPGAPRMDRQLCSYGPLARSVDDLVLLASLLVGPDGIDTEVAPVPWRRAPPRQPKSLRILWCGSWHGVPTAGAVSTAVEEVARKLAAVGAHVEEGDPGFSRAQLMAVWDEYFPLVSEAAMEAIGLSLPVKAEPRSGKGLVAWIKVQAARDALVRAIDDVLSRRFDAFLCPAANGNAFVHSSPRAPFEIDGCLVDSRFVDHYLFPFNLLGNPCVVLPAGLAPDGLPVGVQLVGPRYGDEALLAVARAVDMVTMGYRKPPLADRVTAR
jgi:amidase